MAKRNGPGGWRRAANRTRRRDQVRREQETKAGGRTTPKRTRHAGLAMGWEEAEGADLETRWKQARSADREMQPGREERRQMMTTANARKRELPQTTTHERNAAPSTRERRDGQVAGAVLLAQETRARSLAGQTPTRHSSTPAPMRKSRSRPTTTPHAVAHSRTRRRCRRRRRGVRLSQRDEGAH